MSDKITKSPKIRFVGFTDAWEQRRLGSVAEFSKGNGYTKNDLRETGFPVVLYGRLYTKYETIINNVDTFVEMKDKSVISEGNEVVVPASGESAEDISRASVIGKPGFILGGDLNIIKPKQEVNSTFLALTISNGTQKKEMSKRAQGKSVVHLHNSDLKEINLLYPKLEEQQQIGIFFANLDNLITLHQRKLELLKDTKKSLLQKMFPKDGANVPEIRFAGFTDAWEQLTVSELANRYDNLRVPITASERVAGSTPYYGANGIQDYVEGFTHDGEFILVAEDGASDLQNYPVQYVNGKVWVNNHAHVLQAKPEIADNKFLMNALKHTNIEPYLVGGGRAKLNADVMMKISFRVPELAEQKQIGSFFANLDHLTTLHQRELNSLENMKKSLLQQMFT